MRRERGLIVGVEIGPVHSHHDLAPYAHDLANPRTKQVPGDHARVAQQPVDLFDRRLGEQPTRLRERLTDQGHRKRRPGHDPERSIGQREDAFRVQVIDQYALQEFMNEIRSLLRRPHRSARQMILHPASRKLSNSGVFESRKMRGFLSLECNKVLWNDAWSKCLLGLAPKSRYVGVVRARLKSRDDPIRRVYSVPADAGVAGPSAFHIVYHMTLLFCAGSRPSISSIDAALGSQCLSHAGERVVRKHGVLRLAERERVHALRVGVDV